MSTIAMFCWTIIIQKIIAMIIITCHSLFSIVALIASALWHCNLMTINSTPRHSYGWRIINEEIIRFCSTLFLKKNLNIYITKQVNNYHGNLYLIQSSMVVSVSLLFIPSVWSTINLYITCGWVSEFLG